MWNIALVFREFTILAWPLESRLFRRDWKEKHGITESQIKNRTIDYSSDLFRFDCCSR